MMRRFDSWNTVDTQTFQYWLGVVFFVFVLVGLSVGGWQLFERLSNRQLMPMRDILVSGDRVYVDDADLQQALNGLPEFGNFFSMNVNRVQQALVALPWVARVSVRKQWPNKLRVHLNEHQVVAHWNSSHLLNSEGEVFDAPQQHVSEALAQLSGPDDQAANILASYREMKAILGPVGLEVASLAISDRHSWTLTLTSQQVLMLGRKDIIERVQRWVGVLAELDIGKLEYVDLRYDTGFAVGWKQQKGSARDDQSNG
jgi:cell division protein FtsQ